MLWNLIYHVKHSEPRIMDPTEHENGATKAGTCTTNSKDSDSFPRLQINKSLGKNIENRERNVL